MYLNIWRQSLLKTYNLHNAVYHVLTKTSVVLDKKSILYLIFNTVSKNHRQIHNFHQYKAPSPGHATSQHYPFPIHSPVTKIQ